MALMTKEELAGSVYFVVGRGTEGGNASYKLSVAGISESSWRGSTRPDFHNVALNSGYTVGAMQLDMGARGLLKVGSTTSIAKGDEQSYVDAVIAQSKAYAAKNGSPFPEDASSLRATLLTHGNGAVLPNGKTRSTIEFIDADTRDAINAWASSSGGRNWIHQNVDMPIVRDAASKAYDVVQKYGGSWTDDAKNLAALELAKVYNQTGNLRGAIAALDALPSPTFDDLKAAVAGNLDAAKALQIGQSFEQANDSDLDIWLESAQRKVLDPHFDPAQFGHDADLKLALLLTKTKADDVVVNDGQLSIKAGSQTYRYSMSDDERTVNLDIVRGAGTNKEAIIGGACFDSHAVLNGSARSVSALMPGSGHWEEQTIYTDLGLPLTTQVVWVPGPAVTNTAPSGLSSTVTAPPTNHTTTGVIYLSRDGASATLPDGQVINAGPGGRLELGADGNLSATRPVTGYSPEEAVYSVTLYNKGGRVVSSTQVQVVADPSHPNDPAYNTTVVQGQGRDIAQIQPDGSSIVIKTVFQTGYGWVEQGTGEIVQSMAQWKQERSTQVAAQKSEPSGTADATDPTDSHSVGAVNGSDLQSDQHSGSGQTTGGDFYDTLLNAFQNPQVISGPGTQYAGGSSGTVTDAGGAGQDLQPNRPLDFADTAQSAINTIATAALPGFTDFLNNAGASLSPAQQEALATQIDALHLCGESDLSFITLPGGGATLIQNADGEIVGEINRTANGYTRLSSVRINEDGSTEPHISYVAPNGQALTAEKYEQAQVAEVAGAVGLMNSIIGLQHWSELSEPGQVAALASIYNTVDKMAGNALPGELTGVVSALGLLNALDQGNAGGALYSGLSLVEHLTADAVTKMGLVSDTFGGNFLPGLGLVLALDSGDPVSILAAAANFIPVYGQVISAVISILGSLFADDDIPMKEGQAQAHWDEAGNILVSTTQDVEGGGASATGWMNSIVSGLQERLAEMTDEAGNPLYGLVPQRLPSLGYQHDPDGFNYAGAQGHLYLKWVDEHGQEQTRYYDGAGNRSDATGETLVGDFMKHAAQAIVPAWEAQTILAHWKETQASEGLGAANEEARQAADSGLPQEAADQLTQTLSVLTFDLPASTTPQASQGQHLIDIDGDGYLEQTQWVQANQALLAIDLDGSGGITAGELLNLGAGSTARNSLGWLDANGDHRLDARDPAFVALRVWLDANGDGQSQGSELQRLGGAAITAIDFTSNPPSLITADGSRTALTQQQLTGDVLGVAYAATAGGLLESKERGETVLHAVNTRAFDGDAAHTQGGDADSDGMAAGQSALIEQYDARLSTTTARTLAGSSTQQAQTPAIIMTGTAGSVLSGQGQSQANTMAAGSTQVRSNGVVFVPAGAITLVPTQREVTAAMVRSADSGLFGVGNGATPLAALALGAGAVQWPSMANAGSTGSADLADGASSAPTQGKVSSPPAQASASLNGQPGQGMGNPAGLSLEPLRIDLSSLPLGRVITAVHPQTGAQSSAQSSAQSGIQGQFTPIDASNQAPVQAERMQGAIYLIANLSSSSVLATPSIDAGEMLLAYPEVVGERIAGTEDRGLRFAADDLLANDSTRNVVSDPAQALLRISAVGSPLHGQVALRTNAQGAAEVVFIPEANYHGPASFSYTVTDPYGLSTTATAMLEVTAVNDAPAAQGEAASGDEDKALLFNAQDLLANDFDVDTAVDGDVLRITRVGAAEHGTVSLQTNAQGAAQVVFIPEANYHGPARFSYWVGDRDAASMAAGVGYETAAIVDLTVRSVDDTPVALGETASGQEDRSLLFTAASLLANDSDGDTASDGDVLHIGGVGPASHGQVFLQPDGTVRFVPEANYHGPASFSYAVTDQTGLSASASVTLDIAAVNDAPVTQDETASGDEDNTLMFTAASLLANDFDVDTATDGDVLRITRVGQAEHGQVYLQADGTVRFVPDANYNGPASFTYWVGDRDAASIAAGVGYERAATMRLTVLPVNDLPVVTGESMGSDEDVVLNINPALLLANDTDVDTATNGQVLSISAVSGAQHGTVALLADGTIQLTPEQDYFGAASFVYTVDDGNGGRVAATAVVNLAPVNDAPEAVGETVTFNEDEVQTIGQASLLANDSDIDNPHSALHIVSVDNASHGTAGLNPDGSIRFAPEADYFGAASFTYTVSDGVGGFTVAMAVLDILPVNDAPRLTGEAVAVDEDQIVHLGLGSLLANDADVDNPRSELQIVAAGNATHGTVQIVAGEIVFTPTLNYFGQASFTYTVSDGVGGQSQASVNLTLNSVNDAPVVNNEMILGKRDVSYTLSQAALLANDTDAESPNSLRIVAVQNVQHGSAALAVNGVVTFTPEAGYAGKGSFEYVVQDSEGAQTVGTSEIDFSRVNLNPVATDDSFSGYEDTAFVIQAAQLLVNDVDTDGSGFTRLSIDAVGAATHGTVGLAADGSVRFDPVANFHGTASFQYRINDGEGGQTWATAFLNVQSVNDAPVIEDIWYGDPLYDYYVWKFVPGHYGEPVSSGGDVDHTYTPYNPPAWRLVPVSSGADAQLHAQLAGQTLAPPAGDESLGSKVDGLMTSSGAPASYSFYQSGEIRPNGFSNVDATDTYSTRIEDGVYRTDAVASDDPFRQHGDIKAYDPDGDSAAIIMSVASGPQHGHLWVDAYTPNSTSSGFQHTVAPTTLVPQAGAWQYYSHFGDPYSGGDPFSIRVTDGAGASTDAMLTATHFGTNVGGGGGGCCPVVVDLAGDGIELIRPEDSRMFADVNDDGWRERIGWAAASDGVLAFDVNNDGKIARADEVSFVGYKEGARTDLEGLAAFDTDNDGKLTANDAQWARFGVLQDANANGRQDAGELRSLGELGISSISLLREGTPHMTKGNAVFGTSEVQWTDGHATRAGDVMFAGENVPLPDAVVALMQAAGEVHVMASTTSWVDDPARYEQARVNQMANVFNQFVNTATIDTQPLGHVSLGGEPLALADLSNILIEQQHFSMLPGAATASQGSGT